ncbi:hypothetical protein Tco_0875891 [Tanacetum coccineum]|uniref:Uncharacterized protein n=1 Tax=Tanacetum coccineum TaxID=301880 RepID=A0ABQ5BQQ9_9ASTR
MELNLSTKTLMRTRKGVGIFHQKTSAKDSTAERRCRKTEPNSCRRQPRTMLILSKAPDVSFWAELVANCLYRHPKPFPTLIHNNSHDKTPYGASNTIRSLNSHFSGLWCSWYPTDDSRETPSWKTNNQGLICGISLNASSRKCPGPAPNLLTSGPISSGLVPNPAPVLPYDPLPSVVQDPVIPTSPSVSMSIDLDAPSGSHTSSPLDHHSSSVHQGVAGEQYAEVPPFDCTLIKLKHCECVRLQNQPLKLHHLGKSDARTPTNPLNVKNISGKWSYSRSS